MIYIGEFSIETRDAWESYFNSYSDCSFKSWITFKEACEFYFLLCASNDSPELFPRGKWASLQMLRELIEKQAVEELLLIHPSKG